MPLWSLRLHTRPPLVSLPCCNTDRGRRSLTGRDKLRHRGILHVVASASKQDLSSLCHSIQQGYYEVGRLGPSVSCAAGLCAGEIGTMECAFHARLVFYCCLQLCVENAGRPAAAALTQMVRSAACAFKAGHSMDRLRLEVEHGGFNEVHLESGSCCLTETDKQYRTQFLDTVRCI